MSWQRHRQQALSTLSALNVVVVLLGACTQPATPSPPRSPATSDAPTPSHGPERTAAPAPTTADVTRGITFALLADNRLLAEQRLAPPPHATTPRYVGHFLALSTGGKRLYVLVLGESSVPDRVVVLDSETAANVATFVLSGNEGVFDSLTIGSRTGRLYPFGNRENHLVIAAMDPGSGVTVTTWDARILVPQATNELQHPDWQAYEGVVTGDEQRFVVSYLGTGIAGIDWFDVTDHGIERCQVREAADQTCISGLGDFALLNDRLLIATATTVILEEDWQGTIQRGFDTILERNRLLPFVVDVPAHRLYAVGSCGYVPGFSALDLQAGGMPTTRTPSGEWQWRTPPAPPQVHSFTPCGGRLALGVNDTVVVGKIQRLIPQIGSHGTLLFVDTRTGQTLQTVDTPSEPVDVLVAPGTSPANA